MAMENMKHLPMYERLAGCPEAKCSILASRCLLFLGLMIEVLEGGK